MNNKVEQTKQKKSHTERDKQLIDRIRVRKGKLPLNGFTMDGIAAKFTSPDSKIDKTYVSRAIREEIHHPTAIKIREYVDNLGFGKANGE